MSSIKVCKRDFSVKPKQMRRNGLIPGSVYGGPLDEAISLQLEEAEVRRLLAEYRIGSRLDIELDGKEIPVQLKEKDVDAITNKVLHVSFQALKAGQKVNSVITIILTNADKVPDGLDQMMTEIPYSALPRDMVDTVTVDVNGMKEGDVITVADIPELQSDKLDLQVNPEEAVVRVIEKKAVVEETEEEASDEETTAE